MSEILAYFEKKAADYDRVDEQVYWRLSDQLLWEIFNESLSKLPLKANILDAGGGTGRWTERALRAHDQFTGTVYDLSPDMLREAQKKSELLEGRLSIRQGNLEEIDLPDNSFDLSYNFHNVLGFVKSPEQALREISRVTKPGGEIISFVPNKYHVIFFNISIGALEEAEVTANSDKGRFTKDMPYMNVFTPESMKELYDAAGIEVSAFAGFPAAIYPGYQETQIEGSSERLAEILQGEDHFNRILDIERKLMKAPGLATRGNNLYVIGVKRT